MKKIGIFGLGGIVAVAGVVLAVTAWCGGSGGTYVKAGFDNRIELTSQEVRHIEEIGEWEFIAVRCEVVVDTLRKGFFSDDRLVAIYTGTPRLGIDLGRVERDWVMVAGDTVTLSLPPVGLLDEHFVDEARTRVFYESGTWTGGARKEMYVRACRKMREQCMTKENLYQAEENARKQFAAMFRALGFQTIVIKFVKK